MPRSRHSFEIVSITFAPGSAENFWNGAPTSTFILFENLMPKPAQMERMISSIFLFSHSSGSSRQQSAKSAERSLPEIDSVREPAEKEVASWST